MFVMFFRKKHNENCARCGGALTEEFSYCPYCGVSLIDKSKKAKDYGLLGNNDVINDDSSESFGMPSAGIADKLFSSVFNNLVKNLDKQISKDMQNAEISPMPNGFKIVIGGPQPKKRQPAQNSKTTSKKITEEQMQKLIGLPKKDAKSKIKRIGDKVIYELAMPGVSSPEDVFISKLESGYEIKSLGKKNVYVSRLNVELPLKGIGLDKNSVLLEFSQKEN